MRGLLAGAAAAVVLVLLWPVVCMSSEGGPTSCSSLVLPLPWGESADTWGMLAALGAAALTFAVVWLLLGSRSSAR